MATTAAAVVREVTFADLADIAGRANPATTEHSLRAFLADVPGLDTATAGDLAALIRDASDRCEHCRALLPPWAPSLTEGGTGLKHCDSVCRRADQARLGVVPLLPCEEDR